MDMAGFSSAVSRWTQALGDSHVLTDPTSLAQYTNNVSGVKRAVPAILRPGSSDDVVRIVEIANECRMPLYPLSCGRNWGLGSKLPARDGTVIVDLSRMNRIREVNVPGHYAVVEPGVTQRQMYEYLVEHKLPLVMNVTGAAKDTSLIGNALERGIGYFASRADSLSGMEIVLGSGRVVRTGFGHFETSRITHVYRYGIGPQLDGLFAQSNFGIVTAAGVDLMPARDECMAVISKISDPSKLAAFVDAMADLRRRDVIQTVAHIGNRHRTQIAMAPLVYRRLVQLTGRDGSDLRGEAERLLEEEGFGPWSSVAGVMGTAGQLRAVRREVCGALRGIASTMFMTDRKIALAKWLARVFGFSTWVRRKQALLEAVEPLYGLAKGIPTDAPMGSVYWPVGDLPLKEDDNPDQSRCGMLYCCPFLPADGAATQQVMDRTELVFRNYGFVPYVTLNMVDSKSLECVINLAFDRDKPERVASAHACNDELTQECIRLGYLPYRVGPQSMPLVVNDKDSFWQTVRDLKRALDPNGIIAPGRYNLD